MEIGKWRESEVGVWLPQAVAFRRDSLLETGWASYLAFHDAGELKRQMDKEPEVVEDKKANAKKALARAEAIMAQAALGTRRVG